MANKPVSIHFQGKYMSMSVISSSCKDQHCQHFWSHYIILFLSLSFVTLIIGHCQLSLAILLSLLPTISLGQHMNVFICVRVSFMPYTKHNGYIEIKLCLGVTQPVLFGASLLHWWCWGGVQVVLWLNLGWACAYFLNSKGILAPNRHI